MASEDKQPSKNDRLTDDVNSHSSKEDLNEDNIKVKKKLESSMNDEDPVSRKEQGSRKDASPETILKNIASAITGNKDKETEVETSSDRAAEVFKRTSLQGVQFVVNYYSNVDNSVSVEKGGVAFGAHSAVQGEGATIAGGNVKSAEEAASAGDHKQSKEKVDDATELSPFSQAEEWFAAHLEPSDRVLMLTLAILNGSNYQIALEASKQLSLLIYPPSTQSDAEKVEEHKPLLSRSKRLKRVCAHLEKGFENKEYGTSLIKRVVFDEPAMQSGVLQYVMEEEDDYFSALLAWIEELGHHKNFEIRVMASAVAGEISRLSFDTVKEAVFLPWAKSDRAATRRLAALALSVPAFEENTTVANQALKLIGHWVGLKTSPSLRWTAISAYGAYIGLRFPALSLDKLRKVIESDDVGMYGLAADNTINLFETSKFVLKQNQAVLEELIDWTDNASDRSLRHIGLLTFVGIMQGSKREDDESKVVPTALFFSEAAPQYEALTGLLVRRALNLKLTRRLCLESIEKWLEVTNHEEALFRAIGRILSQICIYGNNREKERIESSLMRWAECKNTSARKILNVLKRKKLV
ncbi:MAG: hypothetical protein AAF716_16640 [Cyanobacteria bacterium P01_D01_bin.1]